MKASLRSFFALLVLLLLLLTPAAVAAGEEQEPNPEGLRETWRESFIVLKEPVVSRTVVENCRRLTAIENYEARRRARGEKADLGLELPSAEDCGLHLFSVSGSPAPRLRWVNQNKLQIFFAPGSSPQTEFRIVFNPGTTYLGGAPLASPAFSFRCRPVELSATWLTEYWGGAALLSSLGRDTKEALELAERHEGLRVCFRRMRKMPLAGWVCTGTVPATLRPATLADGFGNRAQVLEALMEQVEPEAIREDTPLPQCLLVLPERPLVPGAHYELGVEAAEGSGFESGTLALDELPKVLEATLKRELVQEEGAAPTTRLQLRFSHPVPEGQLRALWGRMGVRVQDVAATRQEDGCYRAELAGQGSPEPAVATLRLRGLLPCDSPVTHWRGEKGYRYAPKGCAQGLEMELLSEHPLELHLTLPPDVQTRHGLALMKERTLSASVSPAALALTGNGCNLVPWSAKRHELQLPLVNVGEVTATAYHWDAASAARLLPVIQHSMRDDTLFCSLYQRLMWLHRRADEGLSTEGWAWGDARTEAGRALKLLQEERAASDPLREQVLAAATSFAPQALAINGADNGNGLMEHGWAKLDLDALTGGQLRPGLYLISLHCRPTAEVVEALTSYGMKGDEPALACSVDVLVQVTDMSLRFGSDRLLVNSLVTGQPLDGGKVTLYSLPEAKPHEKAEDRRAAASAEALPPEGVPAAAVKQGEAVLPEEAEDTLLLVQRGEDYAFFSLWRATMEKGYELRTEPLIEMFCDRPLYRPGETAHLRAVLRRPVKGGLALPRARRATLTIRKPGGEVMETRTVPLDAYGALSADVTLPKGEEDVAGRYVCELEAEESGQRAEGELSLYCEVFRRDAFKASLSIMTDPVAPAQYRVEVQARDYNGTPLAGGRVELELSSPVMLLDEAGNRPEALEEKGAEGFTSKELKQALVLDAEGRAVVSGRFGDYEEEKIFNARASVSNDREEYVRIPRRWELLHPADFSMNVDEEYRLQLHDVSDKKHPLLAREQDVELRILIKEEKRCELPSGIWYTELQEREVARHRITVPANCKQGVELAQFWKGAKWYKDKRDLRLCLSGRDAEGRLLREDVAVSAYYRIHTPHLLKPEGRSVRMEPGEPFRESGKLHAYIVSQGQTRHALVSVRAGEESVSIPLRPQEYGDVCVTLVSCGKDERGLCTRWEEASASCSLPRPDKELKLEFSLPADAKPGDKVTLSGRVLGTDGQPVKAAITLFAVDAGMMSVKHYELPQLAGIFYEGTAEAFTLSNEGAVGQPCEPLAESLPNVWQQQEPWFGRGGNNAFRRSLMPAGMDVGGFAPGTLGAFFRWEPRELVRAARPNFQWSNVFGGGTENQDVTPAPAPVVKSVGAAKSSMAPMGGGLRSGSGELEADECAEEEYAAPDANGMGEGGAGLGAGYRARALAEVDALREEPQPAPRLRKNFEPVALWLGSLESAEDGSFTAECSLPDTLTTYKVYAVALDKSGTCFGQAEGEFLVNQDLMLTAGTPFFMSSGDKLLLPLTVTNNRETAGEWSVALEGAGEVAPQRVTLAGKETATLYFEVQAGEEGECTLRWTARSADGADAVEGSFPVRYPAPLLREAHRLVLAEGAEAVATASLLAPEVAEATRGEVELQYSTSPLIHLAGSVDFLLSYPYGCTEQRASALLPWIFYEHLAPFCPQMAMTSAGEAKALVERHIAQLLARQQEDGGLSYWSVPKGEPAESCRWASAYAGLVLTLAKEQGFAVPQEAHTKLQNYLGRYNWYKHGYLTQYAVARTRGRSGEVNRILVKALRKELKMAEVCGRERETADLEFMAALQSRPEGRHEHLLSWLRGKGRDYRHRSSWDGGWTLIALGEYLKREPKASGKGSVLVNGELCEAESKPGSIRFKPSQGQRLHELMPALAAGKSTVYANVKVKAQPERTEYPGVTEKGLQVTRVYEVKDAEGQWRETTAFKVGDVVRVTLTCAKIAQELEYFVLEDYLPACMEAINPNVPGQAAGLEDEGWGRWSAWFDHKEYLADRVRGFCTRWAGNDLVNMSYYARVKRAGESTAAPASAQLMYEPQTYGLSPNARVTSTRAQAG